MHTVCMSKTYSTCEATDFEEGPYGVTMVLNGVPQGNTHYYTRQALRREAVVQQLNLVPLF